MHHRAFEASQRFLQNWRDCKIKVADVEPVKQKISAAVDEKSASKVKAALEEHHFFTGSKTHHFQHALLEVRNRMLQVTAWHVQENPIL